MKQAVHSSTAGSAASPIRDWLALPIFLAPLVAVLLLLAAARASADGPSGDVPRVHDLIEDARSQVPLLATGSSDGFAYSLSSDAHRGAAGAGRPGAEGIQPALRFGLGRELGTRDGAFSLGGAVELAQHVAGATPAWSYSRDARPEFGPQFGYRSNPRSHFAAEVVGSYFYSRNRWVGHTFVGWRDNDGWAVGPELWRLGTGYGRSNGGGIAIHDIRLKPLRLGFRAGLETRSALGRRYIGGIELSWDNP